MAPASPLGRPTNGAMVTSPEKERMKDAAVVTSPEKEKAKNAAMVTSPEEEKTKNENSLPESSPRPLERVSEYFGRWRGVNEGLFPPFPTWRILLWSFLGSFCGIAVCAALTYNAAWSAPESFVNADAKFSFLIGSFGASAVLIYGAIDSPLAQPRNLVGGHLVSAASGIVVAECFAAGHIGYDDDHVWLWVQCGLAVAFAIFFMQLFRFVHPPGGATALIAVTSPKTLRLHGFYVLIPVLSGILIMLLVALIINNMKRQYPLYWWHPTVLNVPMVDPGGSTHHTDHGEEFAPHMLGMSPRSVHSGGGGSVRSGAGGSVRSGVGGSMRSGKGSDAYYHGDGSLRRGEAFSATRLLPFESGSVHRAIGTGAPLSEIRVHDSSQGRSAQVQPEVGGTAPQFGNHDAPKPGDNPPPNHHQHHGRDSWGLGRAHLHHQHHLVDQRNIEQVLRCLDEIVARAQGPAQKEIWRVELERALHKIQSTEHPVWQEAQQPPQEEPASKAPEGQAAP